MPEYDNKNTFVLFKNDRKTETKHPDYTGSFTDEHGREYFADAWIKEGAKGKFMSGRVKLKDKQKNAAPAPTTHPAVTDLAESDAPF